MRDIADTLAFLAIKTLIDGGFDLGPDRKDMRRTLSGAFEDLLNRLPESAVPVVDPLGYVVLEKRPLLVSGYRYTPVGAVEHDAEFLAYRKTHHPLSDGEYAFAEVREVQS